MVKVQLCHGCDTRLPYDGAFCPSCEERMPTYIMEYSEERASELAANYRAELAAYVQRLQEPAIWYATRNGARWGAGALRGKSIVEQQVAVLQKLYPDDQWDTAQV